MDSRITGGDIDSLYLKGEVCRIGYAKLYEYLKRHGSLIFHSVGIETDSGAVYEKLGIIETSDEESHFDLERLSSVLSENNFFLANFRSEGFPEAGYEEDEKGKDIVTSYFLGQGDLYVGQEDSCEEDEDPNRFIPERRFQFPIEPSDN